MNFNVLKTRKEELEQARTNAANSWQMLSGQIVECDYQISLIKKQEETKADELVDC